MAGFEAASYGLGFILNVFLPILLAVCTLVFVWGVLRFLWSASHEKERERGKMLMLFGAFAFFLVGAVWILLEAISGLLD